MTRFTPLEDEGCVVAVDARFKDDFNVSITGNGQDGLNVDVYLPGETEALVLDHSDEYSVNIGQDFPVRIEWAEGDDFPMGTYTFIVGIDDIVLPLPIRPPRLRLPHLRFDLLS